MDALNTELGRDHRSRNIDENDQHQDVRRENKKTRTNSLAELNISREMENLKKKIERFERQDRGKTKHLEEEINKNNELNGKTNALKQTIRKDTVCPSLPFVLLFLYTCTMSSFFYRPSQNLVVQLYTPTHYVCLRNACMSA